jgi:hypothetical protein
MACVLAVSLCVADVSGQRSADTTSKSSTAAQLDTAAPYWRSRVRMGSSGPSRGAPPSGFRGEHPPGKWCLAPSDTFSARTPADFAMGAPWTMREWSEVSLDGLKEFLSDTSDDGAILRKVFGGAPLISTSDNIEVVADEKLCRSAARVINRDLLGWSVGPPPIALFRVRHYLFAYPSNAFRGEWGYVVGMDEKLTIRGVGTW